MWNNDEWAEYSKKVDADILKRALAYAKEIDASLTNRQTTEEVVKVEENHKPIQLSLF